LNLNGIIISADKVQKDLVDLAPIVKGPIDLSDLQKSTDETRKLLQDINIVLNPTELQKTLSDWNKCCKTFTKVTFHSFLATHSTNTIIRNV
jgi:hypothetical protein